MLKRFFLVLPVLLFFVNGISGPSSKFIAAPINDKETKWVDSVIEKLSPRDRIAQLFMIAAYSNLGEKHIESIKQDIKKYKIGGLIFFQGTPEKQVELTNTYQTLSTVPLLIGMDAEWGVGMRLKDIISYPRQMTLGALRDNQLIYNLGAEFARQCQLLGVHVNFAPSVDVNNNPQNPVINTRSFGENQHFVAEKGIALVSGMQDNKVLACAKHFPGHGDTGGDSHHTLPEITCSRDRLDSLELKPFKELIDNGVSMVMVGHLNIPALEENNRPASISNAVINGLLFNQLGFEGIAISDALNMKGVKDNANGENVTVAALKAGNDILLMPSNIEGNIKEIEAAIEKGELSQEELDRKCRKILTVKYRVGLSAFQKLDAKNIRARLNSKEAYQLRDEIIESAITLVNNKNNLLPINDLRESITCLSIGGNGSSFRTQLAKYTKINQLELEAKPNKATLKAIGNKLANSKTVIVGYHCINNKPEDNFGVDTDVINFLQDLSLDKNVILTCFGTPYSLSKIEQANKTFDAIIVAYDNAAITQRKTAQMIFGGLAFKGELPVSPNEEFRVGDGVITKVERISYLEPEEVNIPAEFIRRADSLAELGIKEKAYPGCQIVAVYKGQVFYEKAFGNHTYKLGARKVELDDVYDVASVTKVSATLPLIMKMVDDHKLNLDSQLSKYVTLTKGSDKGNIKIRDLLLHQAGLVAWIPFHHQYFETPDNSPVFANRKQANYVLVAGTQKYIQKNYRLKSDFFSTDNRRKYSLPVADKLFASESLKTDMYSQIDLSKTLSNTYRYSDLSFIYLQRILEGFYKESIKTLIQDNFYHSLGMYNSMYLPAGSIEKERMPPTEDDQFFRRQQVQGYVHDQGAAMFGGVSGHAGLFSTADDLAKLYQMFLNGGVYGGKRYLRESTIEEFTSYGSKISRRALGFDKPEKDPKKKSPICDEASQASYGHTGFTGTMVWVDPERELVYVFLSNRIYPSADNNKLSRLGTRSEILSQFIQGIDQLKKE